MTEVWKLTEKIWNVIETGVEQLKKQYPHLIFHSEKKEQFDAELKEQYGKVMSRFMTTNTKALDSHKQAALIIICCLTVGVIEYPEDELKDALNNDEMFLPPQVIAVNAGLSFMQDCLAERLKEKKIRIKVDKYYFPIPFACNTPYGNSMCRILFYEQNQEYGMNFNVLELADRLFLLEYINLLQHGIDPLLLKEDK